MRKRHMVDISDAAWDKLERLANRLDAAQYVYKGRPRYGKLIELAIEKLEDSTMEWTVEEVWVDGNGEDATEELVDMAFDNDLPPIDEHYTEAAEGWWLANPNITPIQASQAEKDMALYGNAYISADTGAPIKAKNLTFKVSAKPIDPDLLKETTEAVAAAMAIHTEKQLKAEYEAKKSNKSSKLKIYTHGLSHGVSSVSIEVELTQALSAPQQTSLRLHALSVALEYVVNKLEFGDKSIDCIMHNIPWNKLKIEIVFPFDVALKGDLQTIGNAVGSAIEKWLLQGNFIGPLPQAVDIAEKSTGKTYHPIW